MKPGEKKSLWVPGGEAHEAIRTVGRCWHFGSAESSVDLDGDRTCVTRGRYIVGLEALADRGGTPAPSDLEHVPTVDPFPSKFDL